MSYQASLFQANRTRMGPSLVSKLGPIVLVDRPLVIISHALRGDNVNDVRDSEPYVG